MLGKMTMVVVAVVEMVVEDMEGLEEEDLCQSTPGFDIRSMQHEGLYSRIYMS